MSEKNDKPSLKLTTPPVTLAWPKLNEPDFGSKDYPKPDGEFSTKAVARLDDPDIQAFLKKLQAFHDQAIELGRKEFANLKPETRRKLKEVTVNPLYTERLDKETEEPTGEVEFKFAKKASYVAKKGPRAGQRIHAKVAIFDSLGEVIRKVPEIWGGSVAKVSFTATPYFIPGTGAAGVKLNLDAVQLLVLRKGGERSAADYGFGKEEGGYSHQDGSEDDAADEAGAEDEGNEAKGAANPDF
jgi:hypothetical protein